MHKKNFMAKSKYNAGYYGTRITWIIGYMGILALQDADCVTNSCPASTYIPLSCRFGNYTFIGMVINPRMKKL